MDLYYKSETEKLKKSLLIQKAQLLDENKCTSIEIRIYHLTSVVSLLSTGIYNQEYQLSVTIELICPIGFLLSFRSMQKECVCDELLMTHKITNYCNIDTTSITIPNTTWLGVVTVNQNISILLSILVEHLVLLLFVQLVTVN